MYKNKKILVSFCIEQNMFLRLIVPWNVIVYSVSVHSVLVTTNTFSASDVVVYSVSGLEMLLHILFQGFKCFVYSVSVLEQWWRANPNWCVISVQSVFEQNEGDYFGF